MGSLGDFVPCFSRFVSISILRVFIQRFDGAFSVNTETRKLPIKKMLLCHLRFCGKPFCSLDIYFFFKRSLFLTKMRFWSLFVSFVFTEISPNVEEKKASASLEELSCCSMLFFPPISM